MVVEAHPKTADAADTAAAAESEGALQMDVVPATNVAVATPGDAVPVAQQRERKVEDRQPAAAALPPAPAPRAPAAAPAPEQAPMPAPMPLPPPDAEAEQRQPRTPDSGEITPVVENAPPAPVEEAIDVDAEGDDAVIVPPSAVPAGAVTTESDTDANPPPLSARTKALAPAPETFEKMDTLDTNTPMANGNGNVEKNQSNNDQMDVDANANANANDNANVDVDADMEMDMEELSVSSSDSAMEVGSTTSCKRQRASGGTGSVAAGSSAGASGGGGSGSARLSNRVTALALTAEMLSTACTHWLIEECYTSNSGGSAKRALDALMYARALFGDVNTYGRRAGVLDEIRRELAASQPARALDYDWARPGLSLEPARSNYDAWDPALDDRAWAREKKVLKFIRNAILYAVDNGEHTPHLYAPILLVAISVADRAVQFAVDHQASKRTSTTTNNNANANVNANANASANAKPNAPNNA